MNHPIPSHMRQKIDRTIRTLCPLIQDRMITRYKNQFCEFDLRKELVGCILGSQVRHEMAVASTESLEQEGLLDDTWWTNPIEDDFEAIVLDVLSGKGRVIRNRPRYRFPKTRAIQLRRARDELAQISLVVRLATNQPPKRLRRHLVAAISGLGPKQTSMFLRNVGRSFDLAILDTHVLRFLDMHDLLPMDNLRINTLAGYERVEDVVVDYAHTLGYPVGYLDWAIWATMKAARELNL